jgi:GT2 family glycosyltransferase
MSNRPAVSVVIVTHNSSAHIDKVLARLVGDPEGPAEVVVVDNASTDGTLEMVRHHAVVLVPVDSNLGFPAGCNLGAARTQHDTLVFLNPDTEPGPGWLPPLQAALDQPGVGAAQPVLDLVRHPNHYFTSHSELTYLGFAWSTDAGLPIPPDPGSYDVAFPSGAALAIRRSTFEALGGFRDGYFLYLEDVDLGWRLRLMGMRSVQVPQSRVSHDYEFERHARKMYYLERNRLRMVLANFEHRTLWLLAPALAAVEVGVAAAALKNHWFRDKVQAWRDVWRVRADISVEAAQTRSLRRVSDADMIASMGAAFTGITQISLPPFMGFIDRGMEWYRRLVLWILRGSSKATKPGS